MANRLTSWVKGLKESGKTVTLEEVQPLHPEEYPARHLKELLDRRRSDSHERISQPTGMPDGPGPLT